MHENPLVIFPLFAWTMLFFALLYVTLHKVFFMRRTWSVILLMPTFLGCFIVWFVGVGVCIDFVGDTPAWEAILFLPFMIFGFFFTLVAGLTEEGMSFGWRGVLENSDLAWWPKNTWHNYAEIQEEEAQTAANIEAFERLQLQKLKEKYEH